MTPSPLADQAPAKKPTAKARRRLLRWMLGVGITAVTIIAVLTAVYVYPPQGDEAGADLVYVIGPPTPARMDEAQTILNSDTPGALLVSVPPPDSGGAFMASRMAVCAEQGVTCTSPMPFTTKGEALLLNDYARTHDVRKVAVITFTPHVARTRYIFARCSPDVQVEVIGVDDHLTPGDWMYQFAYQTTAFVKAAATSCASDDE